MKQFKGWPLALGILWTLYSGAIAASDLGAEDSHDLPLMAPGEEVAADYQVLRLSLRAHPLALLRRSTALMRDTSSRVEKGLVT